MCLSKLLPYLWNPFFYVAQNNQRTRNKPDKVRIHDLILLLYVLF
jgi:hypothetical protein